MKILLLLIQILIPSMLSAASLSDLQPASVWPLQEPVKTNPTGIPPKTQEWTIQASGDIYRYARQVCTADSYIRCERVSTSNIDWGYYLYRKDNGAYLGKYDRNIAEEVNQDYVGIGNAAEQHRPESAWIARKEAEIAQMEYIAAACNGGAVFCTGMAAKLEKFKELFTAACSAWSGMCLSKVKELQLEIKQKIDYVKDQCAQNDQACFDAVTNGGERQARAQRQLEKQAQAGTGVRPPHRPSSAGRPPFLPGSGDSSPMQWYDSTCDACQLYDGKDAEDY